MEIIENKIHYIFQVIHYQIIVYRTSYLAIDMNFDHKLALLKT